MLPDLIPYLIPLSITVLLSLIMAYYIWRRGGSEALVSIIILLAGAEWTFTYIMEIVSRSIAVKVFWNQMQYIGGTLLISGLLILSLQSIGYDRWITRRNMIFANFIPVIGLGFAFTNKWHGLFWPDHYLVARRGVLWLEHPHGFVYWIYTGYAQLVMLFVIFLLIWAIFRLSRRYRRQAIMILLGLGFTFTVSLLGPFGLNYLHPLNLNQMSFVVSIIPISWGLLRLQIGDVLPVARTAVFGSMHDGVIVIDGQRRIIDANAAAAQILACSKEKLSGQSIEKVWTDIRFLHEIGQPISKAWLRPAGRLFQPGDDAAGGLEAIFERGGQKQIYDVRVSSLADWRNYIVGQVIVLRDITDRVQAERVIQKARADLETTIAERTTALRQANTRLQHELSERRHAEAALRQARDELERRVVERTVDLAQANTQLTHELAVRERAETNLRTSLQEKEVLLKEIHHRVKNNLQVISSMLNLQSGYVTDEQALATFQDSQNRVRSMALIHETLYQSENLALVDFGDYIEKLAAYLVRSYSISGVQLEIKSEPVHLGIDTAVPCGLILNELISNALKHAFPDGKPGQISLSLHKKADNQAWLSIADDGVGLPAGLDIYNSPSLGLQLVHALVGQLGGNLKIKQTDGVQFNIAFPLIKDVPA